MADSLTFNKTVAGRTRAAEYILGNQELRALLAQTHPRVPASFVPRREIPLHRIHRSTQARGHLPSAVHTHQQSPQ